MIPTGQRFSAHEIIAMNEALTTKAANAELLTVLARQVQDQRLRDILDRQAQAVFNQYVQGVNVLQGSGVSPAITNAAYQTPTHMQPKLGLHQPSMPAPGTNIQTLSERSISTIVLNLHKHGAVSWMRLAVECVTPQFRTFLVNSALNCDQMAYEVWEFMNQKGFYQVPTLQDNTTQTMINSFQTAPAPVPAFQGATYQ